MQKLPFENIVSEKSPTEALNIQRNKNKDHNLPKMNKTKSGTDQYMLNKIIICVSKKILHAALYTEIALL